MSGVVGIFLIIGLLGLNALFVGSEFALIAARQTKMEPLVQQGSRAAKLALRAMTSINTVMAAAQLGITICSLLLGMIGKPVVAELMKPVFKALNMPQPVIDVVAFLLAMTVVVILHVVLGEMVPKNLALVGPEKASLVLGPFMLVVVFLFYPVVWVLNHLSNFIVRLFGVTPADEVATTFTRDEIAVLVDESRREGLLDEDEYVLLSGALDFESAPVTEVLVGTDQLVTVADGITPDDLERLTAKTGFSRFPFVPHAGDPASDMIGYLHIKDVLETTDRRRNEPIAAKWVRPLPTVATDGQLDDALRLMQRTGAHLARVVDTASGRVVGVVTLEDVLAELLGEPAAA